MLNRSTVTKHPRRIIHVTIRPRKISPSSHFNDQYRCKNNDFNRNSSKLLTVSSQIKDTWANQNDYTKKHNQNNEKKKTIVKRPCFIITFFSLFILITIIILLLFLLLSKQKIKPDILPVLRWNTTGKTVAGVTGQNGIASNKLFYPYGLALDWSNSLYIADSSNHRIQKYRRDASFGETVAGQANGSNGSSVNTLNYPKDLFVDLNGNIYVSDTENHRIQMWSSGSATGVTVAGITGVAGNALNRLYGPYGIIHESTSATLFIADSWNDRVMRYYSNLTSAGIVAGGNGPGINASQLYQPVSIYFDSISNSLLIVNYATHNVVRWTLGGSNLELIAGNQNGTNDSTPTSLQFPTDVILDPMGNVYVADGRNHRVQFFPAGGINGITIAGVTGVVGTNSTLMFLPYSVVLDNQLNLFVSDCGNSRIQKFMRY